MTKRFLQKQMRKPAYWIILVGIVFVRVLIAACQRVYLMPEGSGIDDMLMIRAAMSISDGKWLGEYGGMTIAKNMGFSLWIWLLHTLRIPFLIGNALLWVGACAFAARALRPWFSGNFARLCLFAFLLFQPVSYASFTMRAYRDSIFPALSLFLFAGVLGFALRLHEKGLKGSLLCVVFAGFGLAGLCLTREDGAALLLFAVCALAFILVTCLISKTVFKKWLKSLFCLVPFAVYAISALGFAAANYANYGVFKVNDLSEGSFSSTYGAIKAVAAESPYLVKIPVPKQTLDKLYEEVPLMEELRPYLEKGAAYNGFISADKENFGGSFYFAIRLAADYAGLTKTGQEAQQFWQKLEVQIETAVQEGRLQSGRNSENILPNFHKSLLAATAKETLYNFFYVMQFEECDPRPQESIGKAELVDEVAKYLHAPVQRGHVAKTSLPYYNWLQKLMFAFCDFLTWLYSIAVWVLLVFAIYKLCRGVVFAVFAGHGKKLKWAHTLPLLVCIGLLFSFVLRLIITSYMEVAAFGIGRSMMYLSGGAPALLLFLAALFAMPLPEKQKLLQNKKTSIIVQIGKSKDLRLAWMFVFGFAFLVLKLVLASAQQVYLNPEESAIDEMMMLRAAQAISEGQWLGEYGWVTLSKHTFFAMWLAFLNILKIPYLLGGQLLWAAASLAGAGALHAAFKKRYLTLVLFVLLLFNPASTANALPYGFISRAYRDNIFPALCLLCIAGVLGYTLRFKEKLSKTIWWLVLAGAGFAACWLTREDGWWILPFVLMACAVSLVFIFCFCKKKQRLWRAVAWVLPFAILFGSIGAWKSMNKAFYGRFILSDFSTGEFADAIGAMTRVKHENWHFKTMVPKDVRIKLYKYSPAFALLEEDMEGETFYGKYTTTTVRDEHGELLERDYSSGAFYWAVREAARRAGVYETPEIARKYFETVAEEINAACESGAVQASGRRSSVNPPIKKEYVLPVMGETLRGLWYSMRFEGCEPRTIRSVPNVDDCAPEETDIWWVQNFLHEEALFAAEEGTNSPYFRPIQKIAFRALDLNTFGYKIVLPLLFAVALVWQFVGGISFVQNLRRKQKSHTEMLLWLAQLGLLFCIILRAAMVAFVTVSSFTIGTYIMYLASIHPLMILYAVVGTAMLLRYLAAKKFAWDVRKTKGERKWHIWQ